MAHVCFDIRMPIKTTAFRISGRKIVSSEMSLPLFNFFFKTEFLDYIFKEIKVPSNFSNLMTQSCLLYL